METETYFCTHCSAEVAVIVYKFGAGHPEIETEYRKQGPKACPICDAPGAAVEQLNAREIDAPGAITT